MLIGDIVAGNARRIPDGEALIFGERRFTWSQLNEVVNRIGNGLLGLGVGPGEPVAYIVNNGPELVALYFALAKIGAVSVPMVPNSVGREIAFVANDVGARLLIAGPEYTAQVEGAKDALKTVETVMGIGGDHPFAHDLEAIEAPASPAEPDVSVDPDAIYAIKYTSGTTGFPKGCMRTHRQHLENIHITLASVPYGDDDRATVSSPLTAGFGISMFVIQACRGIPTVLLPKFNVLELLEIIERERITISYAIGPTFMQFAMHEKLADFDLSSLRRFTGASNVGDAREGMLRMRSMKTFDAGFFNAYGSSEAGGYITFHQPEDFARELDDPAYAHRLESLGREAPFCFIDATDVDLNPLPPGEVGEMVVRSPSTFSGYWNLPDETAKVLRDGRLVTGDLIQKDADGFIYYQGRKRDMIKSGGLSVYPAEVEAIIAQHPKIAEVAVVGIEDARWGEKVVAFAVARGSCTEAEIMELCSRELAGFKRPKELVFLDELPKNASGKISKRDLQENYG